MRMSCKGTLEERCDCVKLSLWFSAQYNVYQKSHPGSIFFFIRLLKFKNNLIHFFVTSQIKKRHIRKIELPLSYSTPNPFPQGNLCVTLLSEHMCIYI